MRLRDKLTPKLVSDFKEHPVWLVIVEQIDREYGPALAKAIDEMDAKSAGKARAFELVKSMPDTLLQEMESGIVTKVRRKVFVGDRN